MPAAERQRETVNAWLVCHPVVRGQLAGYVLVHGPERVLTWTR